MLRQQSDFVLNDPPRIDKVYYNLVIPYTSKDNAGNCIADERFESEDVILDKASDFYMSVVRFDIPVSSTPIFFADIQKFPNLNRNLTTYSVTMIDSGGNVTPQTFVEFETTTPNAPLPPVATAQNPNYPESLYYSVFTYNVFLNMINKALLTCFNSLTVVPPSDPPKMSFDPNSNRFTLHVDPAFFESTLATPVKIYFNNNLFSFFEGFSVNYFGRNLPQGLDEEFIIIENENLNTVSNLLDITQDYPTISSWNSMRSIQLRSALLNVNNEYVPTGLGSTARSATTPIIADFIPLFSNNPGSAVARNTITYTLNSSYKLINLLSDRALTKVSLSIFWITEKGTEIPLQLNYRDVVSCKLLFQRKNTFTG